MFTIFLCDILDTIILLCDTKIPYNTYDNTILTILEMHRNNDIFATLQIRYDNIVEYLIVNIVVSDIVTSL